LSCLADRSEQKWLRVSLWLNTDNSQRNPKCGGVIPTTNDIIVADDEHEFAFVTVVDGGQRINRTTQRIFTLWVAVYLTDDEYVK
jgi:hypothetical protein